MSRTEFVEKYQHIAGKALEYAEKARREGLLALEDELDQEKIRTRDIFEYGLRFVIDGTDREIIDEILSNIINQERDEEIRILMNIQKRAVLSIQAGDNPRITYALLNSFTDIPLEDENKSILTRDIIYPERPDYSGVVESEDEILAQLQEASSALKRAFEAE